MFWPNKTSQELSAAPANRHYTIRYGESEMKEWQRPTPVAYPTIGLAEPELDNPRIIPIIPTQLPPLEIQAQSGKKTTLGSYRGGTKRWVKFWAGWCANCQHALEKLPSSRASLTKHGITPVLVNVDFRSEEDRLASPVEGVDNAAIGESGMQLLQDYLDQIQVLHQPIALPFSILLDEEGRAISFYHGAVDLETLLKDAKLARASLEQRYTSATPFHGIMVDQEIRTNLDQQAIHFHSRKHLKYAKQLYTIGKPYHQPSAEYLANLALCEVDLGNYKEALPQLLEAVGRLAEVDLRYLVQKNIGDCYFMLGDKDKCLEAYVAALKISEDSILLGNIGIVYLEQKKFEQAQTYLRKGVELNKSEPGVNHQVWQNLLKVYTEIGEVAQVFDLLDEGADLGVNFD